MWEREVSRERSRKRAAYVKGDGSTRLKVNVGCLGRQVLVIKVRVPNHGEVMAWAHETVDQRGRTC